MQWTPDAVISAIVAAGSFLVAVVGGAAWAAKMAYEAGRIRALLSEHLGRLDSIVDDHETRIREIENGHA